jgi:5-methylcytosine-specific restriction endonuclease McrA
MGDAVVNAVWERAARRCEYCHLPADCSEAPFQIDHIIARKHHGTDELSNLALACYYCNKYKGPNIAGIDPLSGQLVRLFHPRVDAWNACF